MRILCGELRLFSPLTYFRKKDAMKNTLLYLLCFVYLLFKPLNVFAISPQPVMAEHGMVVSEQHLASQVGVNILKAGGNAIDAAVAVGYALAVVNPCCGNIGGGGFIVIRLANGKSVFLNFRERAALAANSNMFANIKNNAHSGGELKAIYL
jgi:gamma-glutamyltranspeptidase/glutathione hydrolase